MVREAPTARLASFFLLLVHGTAAVKTFGTGNAGQVCLGRPVSLFEVRSSIP